METCEQCGREYKALMNHYRDNPSHKPKKWDKCAQCGIRYKKLKTHWSNSSNCNHPNGNRCITCGEKYSNLQSHYNNNPEHRPKTWNSCNQCEKRYKCLSKHWSMSSCTFTKLSKRQYDICIGLVMGDGTVSHKNRENPSINVKMITEEYLEYLGKIFGNLGRPVRLERSAKESAENNRKTGFHKNADSSNYSDIYGWKTCGHPKIKEFSEWYVTGEKVWPEKIDLTPTVLKHWFVGDGCYNVPNGSISIGLSNEAKNEEKIASYFENVGLPRPNNWNNTTHNCQAVWNVSESEELWEYMLEDGHGIPPGFEYKWPVEYHDDHTITVDDLNTAEAAVA